MCKILALTNATKLDQTKITDIGRMLLKYEQDGFGYAIQGKTNVFGEKSTDKKFISRLKMIGVNLPIVKKRYEKFGNAEAIAGPAIFHGRTSTNDRGLLNCHPMVKESTYLIHNGVVTDHGPKYIKATTNDSEDVLHRFLEGISSVQENLTGYYAFAAIDDMGLLHICRDDMADLYIAWCPKLDSHIIATIPEILTNTAKILQAEIGPIDEVTKNVYGVFKGNELLRFQAIESRGWSRVESQFASASLGKTVPDGNVVTALAPSPKLDQGYDWSDLETEDDDQSGYYDWLDEVDNMDASYEIYDADNNRINAYQFNKLDHISKELCTIYRADGSLVDPYEPDYRREA
jgi:hypothetical protein